jgi:hypothetical protein
MVGVQRVCPTGSVYMEGGLQTRRADANRYPFDGWAGESRARWFGRQPTAQVSGCELPAFSHVAWRAERARLTDTFLHLRGIVP